MCFAMNFLWTFLRQFIIFTAAVLNDVYILSSTSTRYHCILCSVDLEQWKCWIYCWHSSSILAWKASLLNSRLLTWLQMDWRELTVFLFLCSMNPLILLTCPSKLFMHYLKLRTSICCDNLSLNLQYNSMQ